MKKTTKTATPKARKESDLVANAHAIEAADHELTLSRNDENNKIKLVEIATDRRKKAEKHLTELKKRQSDLLRAID